MVVLPTPGSPIRTGLFLVRRDSTCMTRSISFSRPMTGSSLPSRAAWVRFRPNWSSTSDEDGAPSARRAGGRGLLALVAGEQLDDLLADPVEVGAELDQHLGGDALALADQAEQDVLGADVVVAELQRLAQGELEHLLGARRERDVAARRLLALADDLLDLGADGLQRDAEALQRLGRDALALVDQAEQDVLGADVVVAEHPGLFLGQDDNPTRAVGEPLEHGHRSLTYAALEEIDCYTVTPLQNRCDPPYVFRRDTPSRSPVSEHPATAGGEQRGPVPRSVSGCVGVADLRGRPGRGRRPRSRSRGPSSRISAPGSVAAYRRGRACGAPARARRGRRTGRARRAAWRHSSDEVDLVVDAPSSAKLTVSSASVPSRSSTRTMLHPLSHVEIPVSYSAPERHSMRHIQVTRIYSGRSSGKQNRLPNARAGEQHDQPVDAHAHAAGRRHAVLHRRRKSSSSSIASGSPAAASSDCATSRSRWTTGSFSSEYAGASSTPLMIRSNASFSPGFDAVRLGQRLDRLGIVHDERRL